MNSILLVGPEETTLRRLKSHLVRRGFHVTTLGADDLDHLEELKDRFVLGLVDACKKIAPDLLGK